MAHRSSLASLSFTRTTNNSIRTRHHWEFWHMMTRLKHPSAFCITETEIDCIRRVREAATHWQHHAKKFPLSLQFLQWEERARADKHPCPDPSTVGHFVRTTTLILPHEDTREPVVLNHWESDCERKGGEGTTKTSTWTLSDWIYICSQSSNSNQHFCLFTEPSQGCTLTRKLGRVQIWLIWILKQGVLLVLAPSVPTSRWGAESQPFLMWRVFPGPMRPEGLVINPRCCAN